MVERNMRSASGRRGAVADDARAREVGLCQVAVKPANKAERSAGGVGGAKGGDQGKCGPAAHAPDSEPGGRSCRRTSHPPHRSVRAAFPHTAPTSGIDGNHPPQTELRISA
jgi:hypothetical protein